MSDLADMRAREAEKRARREAKMAATIENSQAEASLVPDLSGEIMEGEARLKSHESDFLQRQDEIRQKMAEKERIEDERRQQREAAAREKTRLAREAQAAQQLEAARLTALRRQERADEEASRKAEVQVALKLAMQQEQNRVASFQQERSAIAEREIEMERRNQEIQAEVARRKLADMQLEELAAAARAVAEAAAAVDAKPSVSLGLKGRLSLFEQKAEANKNPIPQRF